MQHTSMHAQRDWHKWCWHISEPRMLFNNWCPTFFQGQLQEMKLTSGIASLNNCRIDMEHTLDKLKLTNNMNPCMTWCSNIWGPSHKLEWQREHTPMETDVVSQSEKSHGSSLGLAMSMVESRTCHWVRCFCNPRNLLRAPSKTRSNKQAFCFQKALANRLRTWKEHFKNLPPF